MRAALLVTLLAALAACERGPNPSPGPAGTTKAPAPEVAAKAIADAKALLGNDLAADPAKAAALLAAAFGDAPADPEAALLLARASIRSEDPKRCELAIEALLARAPKERKEWLAEGEFLRASLAARRGDPKAAIAGYQRAIDLLPNYVQAFYRLGVAQGDAGDVSGAIATLEKAARLSPGLVEVHFNLSRLHHRAGHEAQAQREAEIHRQLDRATANSSRTQEAMVEKYDAYEKLEEILPDFVAGRLQLTRFQVARGMNDVALARMTKLVAERPESNEAWKLLIDLLRKTKGDAAARQELARLLPAIHDLPAELKAALEKIVREGFAQ
jgi:tetratricopeptide (TPR) repeat protein